ncbi:MAG: alpha-L-arabinofuranosidase C-terminal domain-containing protein, partial [Planctomycetota bacterium]
MHVTITPTGASLGHASAQLLGNNIEAYENTVPALLSDRLRNSKFAGPENPQTGIADAWEPIGNTMSGLNCRLLPGMYLSGREAQVVHYYKQDGQAGIMQANLHLADGEEFEIELWARAQHRPVQVSVELRLPGQTAPDASKAEMLVDLAHWHRRTCRIRSPGTSHAASLFIQIPGDSRIIIDQIHLRPVGEGHVSPAVAAALEGIPCPVLRFPGGCATCTYHWEHGVGPVHLRPVCDDPVFKYKMQYDFGTDEYLELCVARNIRPFITLNTTTATPEQAAAWAAYVRAWYQQRKLPIPAAYIMFGNENYGTWEIGHMTGAMYAAQLRDFVPLVRAAYPEARMLAIGEFESGGMRSDLITPWRSAVIEQAAGLFDLLVVTRYAGGPDNLPLPDTMARVVNNLADKQADLQRQADSIRDAKLNCHMGIVEWNYWTRASHNDHAGFFEPNDIRHCLYAAGYLNAFCRLGEILEVANFYSLFNTMGMVHVHDGQVVRSDLVRVFQLYADALPGEVLALEVAAPALTSKGKAVDANFIRRGHQLFGFLVNFSSTDSAAVELNGLGSISDAQGLTARAILEPVTALQPIIAGNRVTLPP